MARRWARLVPVLFLVPLWFSPGHAREISFQHTEGVRVRVLSEIEYDLQFGRNPEIPRSEDEILGLAQRLFPPAGERPQGAGPTKCGDHEVGLLFSALKNPLVSDLVRQEVDRIMARAVPPLRKTYVSKHFKVYYTTNNPDAAHNVTLDEVVETAKALELCWNKYTNTFARPQCYSNDGRPMINIKVYDLPPGVMGRTSSAWNYIELDSKLCVKSRCMRKVTSAHELFHRVQYAYKMVPGTPNIAWFVEGTALWAEKYMFGQEIREYMAYMNNGLDKPNRDLTAERDYDAVHLFIWVDTLYSAGESAYDRIRAMWAAYQTNGKDAAQAVKSAVSSMFVSFEDFVGSWHRHNIKKDLQDVFFAYFENDLVNVACGKKYGPLIQVPRTRGDLSTQPYRKGKGTVKPYGAMYHELKLNPKLRVLRLAIETNRGLEYTHRIIAADRDDRVMTDVPLTAGGVLLPYTDNNRWERVLIIANGGPEGLEYTFTAGCDLTGQWVGLNTEQGRLIDKNGQVTGKMANVCDSQEYGVTGTYQGPEISLVLTQVPLESPPAECPASMTVSGTVDIGYCTMKLTGTDSLGKPVSLQWSKED